MNTKDKVIEAIEALRKAVADDLKETDVNLEYSHMCRAFDAYGLLMKPPFAVTDWQDASARERRRQAERGGKI